MLGGVTTVDWAGVALDLAFLLIPLALFGWMAWRDQRAKARKEAESESRTMKLKAQAWKDREQERS